MIVDGQMTILSGRRQPREKRWDTSQKDGEINHIVPPANTEAASTCSVDKSLPGSSLAILRNVGEVLTLRSLTCPLTDARAHTG